MKSVIVSFLLDDEGQSMVEYTLLLAFMTLASAALFLGASNSIYGIWVTTNNRMLTAYCSAS